MPTCYHLMQIRKPSAGAGSFFSSYATLYHIVHILCSVLAGMAQKQWWRGFGAVQKTHSAVQKASNVIYYYVADRAVREGAIHLPFCVLSTHPQRPTSTAPNAAQLSLPTPKHVLAHPTLSCPCPSLEYPRKSRPPHTLFKPQKSDLQKIYIINDIPNF